MTGEETTDWVDPGDCSDRTLEALFLDGFYRHRGRCVPCNCLLTSCHDAYHTTYGPATDEPAARAACLAEAAALPRAGMDVESGNFLECRLHFCRAGASDESLCPGSVGDAPCQ